MIKRFVLLTTTAIAVATSSFSAPKMENLNRGLVAVHQPDGKVFVTWRLLGNEPGDTAFNLYRTTSAPAQETDWGAYASRNDRNDGTVRLNDNPLTGPTWFIDDSASLHRDTAYTVRPVVNGDEGDESEAFTLAAGAPPLPYHSIPLNTPAGYTPNDGSIGDLTGDGRYEIVIKQEGRAHDNSRRGVTDPVYLQAYTLDGGMLWQIDLGINIRAGAHYTQFMVYDLDGDGIAEIACKTGDGTIDGVGAVIGDPSADWRNDDGYIITGPEYFTIFNGATGAAMATVPYVPSRHPTVENPSPEQMDEIWGDGYGNRIDRFLAGIAYLDGENPSVIMCRGYYTRTVIVAWDWRDGKLTKRWVFDSDASPENHPYRGQGNHSLSIADVDGDGRQEIVYGAMVVDDDGTGLHTTGWGHGDALHVSDFLPSRPGLEIFNIQERFDDQGLNMRDAETGEPIFTIPSVKAAESGGDRGEGPGRGVAANIDPRHLGAEAWAAGAGMYRVFSAEGEHLYDKPRGLPVNFVVWWDGDLQRELLDQNFILKFNPQTEGLDPLLVAHASTSNNGTKATPTLSGDFWGDWREEVVWRTRDNSELRIYTSTLPTEHRMPTLLHDPQYRVALAWQNVAYNQPPHPSFYLGDEDPLPEREPIAIVGED